MCVHVSTRRNPAVERMWHIYDSQGRRQMCDFISGFRMFCVLSRSLVQRLYRRLVPFLARVKIHNTDPTPHQSHPDLQRFY